MPANITSSHKGDYTSIRRVRQFDEFLATALNTPTPAVHHGPLHSQGRLQDGTSAGDDARDRSWILSIIDVALVLCEEAPGDDPEVKCDSPREEGDDFDHRRRRQEQ
jgi:hypothetical protein